MPLLKLIPFLVLFGLVPAVLAAEPPGQPAPEQTDVFVSETNGYNTFRIPALILTREGTLLALCEGRKSSSSDYGDVDLVCRRSEDGGRTWGPLQLIHEEGGNAPITIGNPCAVVDQDTGAILLLFCRNNRDVFITRSRDDGRSWSRPEQITRQVKQPDWTWYATGPGVGIQLRKPPHAGRLVIPCDHRLEADLVGSYSHVIYSDDHGKSWKIGGSADYGTNECQVIEREDGTLLLSMRRAETHDGPNRALATSADGGLTWSKVTYAEALVTHRCQTALIRYPSPDRPLLLFSCPDNPKARWRMTIRLSEDDGRTWPVSRLLYPGRSAYSSLAVLPDGTILCLFEYGVEHYRERIRLFRFPLDWVRGGGAPG